eukprot:COSAG06_NODE_12637_length_1349_cov_4.700000_1_plen_85_part_10
MLPAELLLRAKHNSNHTQGGPAAAAAAEKTIGSRASPSAAAAAAAASEKTIGSRRSGAAGESGKRYYGNARGNLRCETNASLCFL